MYNSKDFSLLYSSKLWRTLAEGFLLLRPMYEFFCEMERCTRKNDAL